jgi:hypothetical protein
MPREDKARQPLCAEIDGFSLHAAVRVEADDRKRLEQLCRYITRPALSDERVRLNAAGEVELKLKTPWRDGTTHLVMSPLEFMQRLAALVPRPRLHLIRFHGVLPPNAKLRPLVVPQGPEVQERTTEVAAAGEREAEAFQARPQRISWPCRASAGDRRSTCEQRGCSLPGSWAPACACACLRACVDAAARPRGWWCPWSQLR